MAKVEMTLKEYDALITELNRLRRLRDAVFEPQNDEDEFERYQKNGGYYRVESRFYLEEFKDLIQAQIDDTYEGVKVDLNGSTASITLGTINFPRPNACLHCGREFKHHTDKYYPQCGHYFYCTECCESCPGFNDGKCYYYKNR